MDKQGNAFSECSEEHGENRHRKGTTPEEGVQGVYASVCALAEERRAVESPPAERAEGCTTLVPPCEVSSEDACSHG